jgi:hypothetical protein
MSRGEVVDFPTILLPAKNFFGGRGAALNNWRPYFLTQLLHSGGQASEIPMVQPLPPGSGRDSHCSFGQSTRSYSHFPFSQTGMKQGLQGIEQPLFLGRGEAHFDGSFSLSRASLTLLTSPLIFPFCGLTPAHTANEQTAINNVNQMKCLYIKLPLFTLLFGARMMCYLATKNPVKFPPAKAQFFLAFPVLEAAGG